LLILTFFLFTAEAIIFRFFSPRRNLNKDVVEMLLVASCPESSQIYDADKDTCY